MVIYFLGREEAKLQVNLPLRDRSLFIALGMVEGGGEAEDSRGDHFIFGRTKGSISRNSAVIQRGGGPLKFAWKMKTWDGGHESHQKLLGGDHFSVVVFKGGIG